MCATVRKRSRWKCCRGQKNGILPLGNFKRSIIFPFLHTSMCSRFTIVFPAESNQKQFTGKEYYHTESAGFYERRLAVEIERLVLRSGPRRGRRWADGRLPAAAVALRKPHRRTSEWHLHAHHKASVIAAVARDTSPGRDPRSRRVGGKPPRGSLAFTAEMLMKA